MKDIRSNVIRMETVRQIDIVVESLADGRLDRGALWKLPPWRAVVLARIARRIGAMSQRDLDALTAEAMRVGVDGVLTVKDAPKPRKERAGRARRPATAPDWTQRGMIQKSVDRRHPGSRHPAVRDSTG